MKKIIYICLQILFLSVVLNAADTVSAKYFPLAVGNKWVYLRGHSNGGSYTYWITVSQITKDTIINNKKYFFINSIPFTEMTNFWIRYDSTNGHLHDYAPSDPSCNHERMFYDLSVVVGDSCNNSYTPCTLSNYYCTQINDTAIFGFNSRVKTYYYSFSIHNGGSSSRHHFTKNIGYLYGYQGASSVYGQNHNTFDLRGFVINGLLYGDTTLTLVNTISTIVPEKYSLSQNYPNPFNPTTTIRYELPRAGVVRLAVYDVMGREIEMLVNERQAAGSYEATFDGSRFASGVYFYRLTAEGYSETKRMLMIK
jgi:hypothetical protein